MCVCMCVCIIIIVNLCIMITAFNIIANHFSLPLWLVYSKHCYDVRVDNHSRTQTQPLSSSYHMHFPSYKPMQVNSIENMFLQLRGVCQSKPFRVPIIIII